MYKKRFTKAMQDVLDFITEYKYEHDDFSPSTTEIMDAVGNKSTSHIRYILNRLEEEGRIKIREGRPGIIVLKEEFENEDLDTGKIKPMGVGLKTGEIEALDGIVEERRVSRNSLMRFAIRWFITQYRAGNVDLSEYIKEPPQPKKTLDYAM